MVFRFGSTSKSSNRTQNNSTVEDNRIAADGEGRVYRLDEGDLTITDGGAFDLVETASTRAFEAAEGVGDISRDLTMRSLDLAADSLARADAAFSDAAARSGSEQAQFFERLVEYAIPAIAIIFIARSVFK
ncbi:hypothetical protein [Cognatiyoonia sp. IB215182]|uniref:hypothetical protein n=1 Tax=Cognatiyoonia sp. IB215182 TaxID=3097353 RepID=UPI002A0E7D7A|nr:hypothetical protein [Cognatiyoonia sp. IB215182]MDX8353664.1 hypothetical protein [Cognatiyoonia sp. IB215182]